MTDQQPGGQVRSQTDRPMICCCLGCVSQQITFTSQGQLQAYHCDIPILPPFISPTLSVTHTHARPHRHTPPHTHTHTHTHTAANKQCDRYRYEVFCWWNKRTIAMHQRCLDRYVVNLCGTALTYKSYVCVWLFVCGRVSRASKTRC